MTAPDTRDSVERIVAEMREAREAYAGHHSSGTFRRLADRLAALPQPFTPNAKLARAMAGAQEASGEDVQRFRMGVAATGCGTYAQPNASPKGEWVRYTDYAALQAEVARLTGEVEKWHEEASGLAAARMAYASEFPLNADGEFDVGNIHANIRALKAALREAQANDRRYRWLRDNCVREWESDMPHNKGAPSLDIDFEANGHDLDAAIDAAIGGTDDA